MIRGAEALGALLERMKERLYRGAEETVAEAAQAVCAEAAARAPVETGRLRSSIHASAEGLTAVVRCDCPYGAAVELGDESVKRAAVYAAGGGYGAGKWEQLRWRGMRWGKKGGICMCAKGQARRTAVSPMLRWGCGW